MRRLRIDIVDAIPADRDVVVEMMLDSTQNFADTLTQKQPFGWHAVKLPSDASVQSTRG